MKSHSLPLTSQETLAVFLLKFRAIFAYYQYKAGTLEVINERLLSLQSEIVDLNLEGIKAN
jgi:hypothetical protein